MSGKFIGIINFNNTSKEEQNKNIKTLINELVDMDYRVLVVDHDEDYVKSWQTLRISIIGLCTVMISDCAINVEI